MNLENQQIETLLIKLFSEKISLEEKALLMAWVNENAQNRKYCQELRNIWQVSHPSFLPEDIDVVGAEKRVMERMKEKKLINSSVIIWWQRVAAILFFPVFLLMGYLLFKAPYHLPPVAYQEIFSPYGMHSKIDLPDGSTVWLNSGSKLKYPVAFAHNERNVYLSGEAFFKVQSDKSHPFIVETERVIVNATGTQFNVEAYLTDTITAVTLVKGKVNVKIKNCGHINMQPDQRIVYNNISQNYQLTETDAKHWGLWKDGVLVFRDESLEEVFKRIGRTYNVDISVKDNIIAHQLYIATFEGESLDEILRLLKMTAPIKYKITYREKQADNEFNKEKIEVYRAQ